MKRLISLLLMLMLLSQTSMVFAGSSNVNSIKKSLKLSDVCEEYNIEVMSIGEFSKENSISKSRSGEIETLKFDTVEEFELFLSELTKDPEVSTTKYPDYSNQKNQLLSGLNANLMYRSSVYSGNHTETKWAPFSGYGMTGLACWRNISYTFKYELREGSLYDPYFTNISENYITSYISGLNAVSWNQTGKSANIANNGKSVMLKVSGYYLLGVEVAGFTIGAKIPDNWKMTSHIDDAL